LGLNLSVIAPEVLLPAVCMGLAYPLANAVVQSAAGDVSRRAGLLYLGNTLGNVVGSLLVGFLLLPRAGMQRTAPLLAVATAVGLVCAAGGGLLDRHREPIARRPAAVFAISLGCRVVGRACGVG